MLVPGAPEEENILHNIVNTSVPVSSFSVAQSNTATWGTLYSGAHLIGPERDSSGAYLHNHFRSQTSQHHLVCVCAWMYMREWLCVCVIIQVWMTGHTDLYCSLGCRSTLTTSNLFGSSVLPVEDNITTSTSYTQGALHAGQVLCFPNSLFPSSSQNMSTTPVKEIALFAYAHVHR